MAFIKRFESASIDNDLESCKDYIETLSEFEENLEASSFKEGYYDGREVTSKMDSEKTPRALQFYLKFKGAPNRWGDSKGDILEKSDFDKSILLTQRAKYLYSKFELYCSNIIVEIRYSFIKFTLLFENRDESEKRMAKIRRIYKAFNSYFSDYAHHKTFHIDDENSKEYSTIISDIKKNDIRFTVIKDIEFRFAVDISLDTDIITIKPKTFRYRAQGGSEWKSLRSNKNLTKFVSTELSKRMVKGYHVERKDIIDNIDVSINDDIINIKVI